jgi:NADH:ubiquinone oxidoreductase subunit 4 (subunit M)
VTETIQAALHAALSIGVILSLPRSERTPRWVAGVLWITACMGGAYLSRSLAGATLGWAGALAPFLTEGVFNRSIGLRGAASLVLFPAQSRLSETFEHGPLLPLSLMLNGHLGALVAARLLASLPPDTAAASRPWLLGLAVFVAGWSAASAFLEIRPRRVFARLMAGQGALILAGLVCGNDAGAAGALALWQAAAVASTMLACVYAGIEARLGPALDRPGFLGLAAGAPRLAVFFAVAAFALGDLPLTLGFPAAELLLLGVLDAGPVGLLLPIIGALNAFVVLRLYARLFWGRPIDAARDLPDALARERWVLSSGLLFLVLGGLLPSALLP